MRFTRHASIPRPKYWDGRSPKQCTSCQTPIAARGEFQDCRMRSGWSLVCMTCAASALEHGSRFRREANGRYIRIG